MKPVRPKETALPGGEVWNRYHYVPSRPKHLLYPTKIADRIGKMLERVTENDEVISTLRERRRFQRCADVLNAAPLSDRARPRGRLNASDLPAAIHETGGQIPPSTPYVQCSARLTGNYSGERCGS